MPNPRIAPLDEPYAQDVADVLQGIMPAGMAPLKLFRTQAQNLPVMRRMVAGHLLGKGTIALRDRELLILRTCARCGAEYEWGVHVALFAERARLGREAIAATLDKEIQSQALSPAELSLLKLVDALHDKAEVGDALWEELASYYRDDQILEIVTVVGYYHTISFIANAARVELESFAPRFADYQDQLQ